MSEPAETPHDTPREPQHTPPAATPPAGLPPSEQRCDLCGAPMLEWHCRIICNYCGYQRDCSDP